MKHIAVCTKEQWNKEVILTEVEKLWSEEGIKCCFTFYDSMEVLREKLSKDCIICIFDVASFGNRGFCFLKKISEERPDLWFVFLDCNPQNAICGFDYPTVSYLIYPISKLDMIRTARKIRHIFPDWFKEQRVELSFDRKCRFVPCSKIDYIRCENRVLYIYLDDGNVVKSYGTITGILEKLPDSTFCRIQKSYVVNLMKVEAIDGKYTVIMASGNLLPMGKKYIEDFNKKIKGVFMFDT